MQPTQEVQPIPDGAPTATQPVPSAPEPGRKRGRLVAAGVLVAAAVAVAAGFVVFSGNDSTSAPAVNPAYTEATTPAERLAAAVDFTLRGGPLTVTTVTNGVETDAHLDHSNGIMYSEIPAGAAGGNAFTLFMRGEEMLVRYAADAGNAKAEQWYRIPNSDTAMAPMLGQLMDPEFIGSFLESAKGVEDVGTEQVDGVDATHFVVTMDKRAVAEKTFESMKNREGADDPAVKKQAIEMMTAMIPDTSEYWVDGSGRLVKEDDGTRVKTYHDFGEPIDLPEIDDSTIEPVPGF